MALNERLALECTQRLAALVPIVAPHAKDVAASGVAEALNQRGVLAEVRFKPLPFGG
jgi:hypothetical protein